MADANLARAAALTEQALPNGTVLADGQFTVQGQLGAGGFGITYRAEDTVLGRTIVIKECFPEEICRRDGVDVLARNESYVEPFRKVVGMFMREARSLAKLRHPNVVGVHRAFEENGTAYMVLDLIDGRDLFSILQSADITLSPSRVQKILFQLLDAIEKVHEMDLLHRDISPDNIIIEQNGTPVLIDFGAARGDASRHTRAVSSFMVVKDGYSPQEFYVAGSEQSASSDLYALAATFYHVISGEAPTHSQTRVIEVASRKSDPCLPLAGRIEGYDKDFLEAIDAAMSINPDDRIQTAEKWRSMIGAVDRSPTSVPLPGAKPTGQDLSLDLEVTLSRLVEETNDEVRRTSQIPEEPKATPPKPRKRTKPAWLEEFNKESLATVGRRRLRPERPPQVKKKRETSFDTTPMIKPRSAQSETDWINRAAEKEERVRSERESQLEIFASEADAPLSTDATPKRAEKKEADLPLEVAETETRHAILTQRKNKPMRYLASLLFVFGVWFFFQGI